MRPRRFALTAIAVTAVLSGCTLIPSPTGTFGPDPHRGGITDESCLDGMNGADSDREAVVDCAQPHLFEVTSIGGWPGMPDLIDERDGDLGAVWDLIHLGEGREGGEYAAWASRFCNEGAQHRIGIDEVVVDGHTAADLWLRVGGTYGIDLSLASREKFVGESDVATVCSLAWYDETDTPRLIASPPFAELLHPGFDADMRECWARDYSVISCGEPHGAQVLLSFEGLEAFGPELIARTAAGIAVEADWAAADGFCDALLQQTLPPSAALGELGSLAETAASEAWDRFDGAVDPHGGYWYSCVAVPFTDDEVTGDVFEGTATVGSGA
jgi:hypothetical protein